MQWVHAFGVSETRLYLIYDLYNVTPKLASSEADDPI